MTIEKLIKFKKQINVRLDEELMDLVVSEVRLRRTTQSQLIRDALVFLFQSRGLHPKNGQSNSD